MNAFQQILVHLDAGASAPHRLAAARALAGRHGASLAALYAAAPVLLQLPYPPETASGLAAAMLEADVERKRATRRMFDETMQSAGPRATWAESDGMPAAGAVAQQALYADLVVLGQPEPGSAAATGIPPDFVDDVVIASGRPALVIPYTGWNGHLPRTAAIAWKETREASRAVAAALPLLKQAQQVHVLSWGEEAPPEASGSVLDLHTYLAAHGVQATWHRGGAEPAAIGDLLLSRVSDLSADLLVMGCYGHTRAREFLLGGASRTVLHTMTVPVLMAH